MKALSAGLGAELLRDLSDPRVVWQLAAIAVCVLLAWGISTWFMRATKAREEIDRDGLRPRLAVVAPVVAVILLLLALPLMALWTSTSLIRMAIALLGSFALIRAVFFVLRRIFARGGRVGNFLGVFERVFALLVWFGVAIWITGLWPEIQAFLEHTQVPLGRNRVSILTVLQGGISVALTLVLALWFGALLEERLMRIDTVHSSLRAVMSRTLRALLIFLALMISLSLVGIDLTVLSVFGGALGVGLGLGLQKIVGSYFSGFVILLERSLSLGDQVKVGEFLGQVVRINTRYTVLRAGDGSQTIVPNDMLVSQVVQNYSETEVEKGLRLSTRVSVGYETDIEALLPKLIAATGTIPRVLPKPIPQALLLSFGADGLDLEIGFWINDPQNGRGNVVSDVNRKIWMLLQQEGINVPYPQRELRFVSAQQDPNQLSEKRD